MGRYLIFGGSIYYAGGGFNDFRGSHDNLDIAHDLAEQQLKKPGIEWYHIVDATTGDIVKKSETEPY